MTAEIKYEVQGDRSGLLAWRSAKGWIVENWSMIQGDRTGSRYLIPEYLSDDMSDPLEREDICRLWHMRDQGACLQQGTLVE